MRIPLCAVDDFRGRLNRLPVIADCSSATPAIDGVIDARECGRDRPCG